MALAGWKTEESMSALPGILDLAAASNMGLAEASDMVTDYLSAFQEEADQAGRMADVLAYAQANSNTTTQGLGLAFKNCAVNANSFGLDIEQTTAVLGKLADQGLKGSEAGTALNAVFRDMSSKMKNGAIEIGNTTVKITDANGNFKSMAEIVGEVQKATDGLSDSEKMVALQSTFTADSIKAMSILMNTGSESITEFTNELYNSSGAASEMAGVMNDNLSGQLTALKSALEGAAISIGEALLPVIKTLVSFLQNLVNWFNGLNPAIKTTIVVIGGIVAAIGPVLLIVGQLCISISGLIAFFTGAGAGAGILAGAIAAITGPVGIAIAAITAFIAIGVLLYKNWDTIKAKCTQIWQNNIRPTIEKVTNTLKSFLSAAWNGIKAFLATCWELLGKLASTIWNGIKNSIETVCNTIKNVVTTIWNGIKTATSSVWEGIKTLISSVVNSIKSVIESVFSSIKAVVSNIFNGIKSVISTVWSAIQSAVTTYVNAVKSVIQSVFSAIQGIISATSNGWKATIQAVWNGIKSVVSTGVNAVKSVITSVWSGLQAILVAPFKAAQSVISGILSGISSSISAVKNAISSVKSAASNVVDKINPFKKSIEFIYSPQNPNTNARFRSDAINLARDLVYSDRSAKASVAESISNVTKSASSMVKDSNNPNIKPGNSVVINNTYNSPKPASIKELKRQDEMQMRRLSLQLGF